MLRSIQILVTVICLISSCVIAQEMAIIKESEIIEKKMIKEETPKDLEILNGRIHLYGNRYIFKENGANGRWFTLLENDVLENVLSNVKSISLYAVKGYTYNFNSGNYLLPLKFEKIDSETSQINQQLIVETKKVEEIK